MAQKKCDSGIPEYRVRLARMMRTNPETQAETLEGFRAEMAYEDGTKATFEHGTKADSEKAERLLEEERYEELSRFLHEVG